MGRLDSNQNRGIQNPSCYRYTTAQHAFYGTSEKTVLTCPTGLTRPSFGVVVRTAKGLVTRVNLQKGRHRVKRRDVWYLETCIGGFEDRVSLGRVLGHDLPAGQALSNLISNAARFIAPGIEPRIKIRSERKENASKPDTGWVRLWGEDKGIGIDPECQSKLFKIFERVRGRETYPGTGIGLAFVRGALERMGGGGGAFPVSGSKFWIEMQARGAPGEESRIVSHKNDRSI